MRKTDNIYFEVNTFLKRKGFEEANNRIKGELVENAFKYYLVKKLRKVGLKDIPIETVKGIDPQDLLEVLIMYMPKEEIALNQASENEYKKDVVAPFVFCLLQIMSDMQGYHINWIIEDNLSLVKQPLVEIENGVWQSLTSHMNTNTLQIFSFLYEAFYENFINVKALHLNE